MKTSIYKSLAALVAISLLLYGCKTKTQSQVENKISFDSIRVEKVYHLFENPEHPNCNLQINFSFPVKMDNKELLEQVQKQFVLDYFGEEYEEITPREAVDKYTESYIESYKELEDDYKLEVERSNGSPIPSWFSYYETSENKIEYNRNNILAYSVSFNNYTGGAHGAHSTLYHVIDLKTGKLISEEEIFIEDYQEQLARILVDKIAELNEVQDAKELENIGFFSIEEIFPNNNFLIGDEGITYAFNEYEIAAYVVGLTEVYIPFTEISTLIRKDSPIAHMVF